MDAQPTDSGTGGSNSGTDLGANGSNAGPVRKRSWFLKVANALSRFAGHATTFVVAVGLVVLWAAVGPVFGFSDTWQLVINTSTTIITFLMVFLIQNTQNRDTAAIQTKLDELIRAADGAHNALLDLEELDESDIAVIREPYEELAKSAREEAGLGSSRGVPAERKATGEGEAVHPGVAISREVVLKPRRLYRGRQHRLVG